VIRAVINPRPDRECVRVAFFYINCFAFGAARQVAVKNGARTIGAGHFSGERFLGTATSTIRALMPRVKLTLSATQSMRASVDKFGPERACSRRTFALFMLGIWRGPA
jgi:hypothetical protein